MATANTGSSQVRIEANLAGYNAAGLYYEVSWAVFFEERVSAGSTFKGSGVGANVQITTLGVVWSGSFGFDWRPGGLQSILLASGTSRVNANADGTPPAGFTVYGVVGDTGTAGGGPGATAATGVGLPNLQVAPGNPFGLTSARVSDTQVNLAWQQSNASNGAPTATYIDWNINDTSWGRLVNLGGATSAAVTAQPNRKLRYRVTSANGAGKSTTVEFPVIYTTPAAPTNVVAAKNASLGIDVSFTKNVDYTEHTHEVWHGVVAGGVTTWDSAALATLASGVTTYQHAAPNASQVHVYQVRALAGALASAYAVSNSVQLLVAPNKPTVPAMPAVANKATATQFTWVHNSVDTSPQTAYEFSRSTDGGSTWTTTGKVASTASSYTVAAGTYAANVGLTTRVRTWGSATTGGADGAGASPWSDLTLTTFKTIPTTSITTPANNAVLNDSTVRATLGFGQAEGATFVAAQLELLQGGVLLEALDSTIRVGITLATPVANGGAYTLRARVQDSNGLWSNWSSNNFTVTYLAPVPATGSVAYLPGNGWAQIDLSIPAPISSQSAAVSVTITREIGGLLEVIVKDYPRAAAMTFLDTTPVVRGTNKYTVTTTSALGSQTMRVFTLVTNELRRAFLSKGPNFTSVGVFGANLEVEEELSVANATIEAAGRIKPVGLYGVEASVELSINSRIIPGFGSTIKELRAVLLLPGRACYRDSGGRRLFGASEGSVSYNKVDRGDLSLKITETS